MKGRLVAAVAIPGAAALLSGWLLGASHVGTPPALDFTPQPLSPLMLTGPDADIRRTAYVRAAVPRHTGGDASAHASDHDGGAWSRPALPADHPLRAPLPVCRFIAEAPTGTSAKFDCVLEGGEVVKVKYGRNPEIYAEAAATQLLAALGYPADTVIVLPRIRCYGCPRFPFATMQILSASLATGLLAPHGYESGYTDFERVSVERKMPAPSIETATTKGWAWWELRASTAPRAELDALRLLAVFLAHWDNKSENQRLICADVIASTTCATAVLMIQDLGATFGPTKANLARWRDLPVWADRRACLVSMSTLPYHGGTFPDGRISEEGRALLAQRLSALTGRQVRALFEDARFHAYQSGTADERDLDAWTAVFLHRVGQIVDTGPCPG